MSHQEPNRVSFITSFNPQVIESFFKPLFKSPRIVFSALPNILFADHHTLSQHLADGTGKSVIVNLKKCISTVSLIFSDISRAQHAKKIAQHYVQTIFFNNRRHAL